MGLRLQNTLSGQLEEFVPLDSGRVRMYTCGPTVYQYAHIGNFRTFVFQDILRRYLRYRGYELRHVMNITDVDDKTIANAAAAGLSLRAYTDKYLEAFFADADLLGLERPEIVARATDHIDDMVGLIERLEEKGDAYRSDGSIYFRIARFPRPAKDAAATSGSGMRFVMPPPSSAPTDPVIELKIESLLQDARKLFFEAQFIWQRPRAPGEALEPSARLQQVDDFLKTKVVKFVMEGRA